MLKYECLQCGEEVEEDEIEELDTCPYCGGELVSNEEI